MGVAGERLDGMNELERLDTGVPGLDMILRGGLVAGSSYIVQGRPGSGKTILANQIAFHQARQGRRVLVATMLAESHDRLFQFLSTLSFFDRDRIGEQIQFVSTLDAMDSEGLDGVVSLLRREIGRAQATLLVVDGLLDAGSGLERELDTKRFIARVQGHVAFAGCTALFLTSARLEEGPEHTMVDGVIELCSDLVGSRSVRRVQLRKTRGSAALCGLHEIEITGDGLVIHPRLEAVMDRQPRPDAGPVEPRRVGSGIAALDTMLDGGLPRASSTLLIGPSGSGKTTMGLAFLASCTPEEPGILFGFYETAGRLMLKSQSIGLPLQPLVDDGALHVLWQSPTEALLDSLGHRLLDLVERTGARRVFIDSLSALARAATVPGRTIDFLTALTSALRDRDVTVLASWEMRDLFGGDIQTPAPELSGLVDNLIMMRFVELRAELRRVVSVLKVRDSSYDPGLREFIVSSEGVDLVHAFEQVASVLTGTAHPVHRR